VRERLGSGGDAEHSMAPWSAHAHATTRWSAVRAQWRGLASADGDADSGHGGDVELGCGRDGEAMRALMEMRSTARPPPILCARGRGPPLCGSVRAEASEQRDL
jgi:hypothetical protein